MSEFFWKSSAVRAMRLQNTKTQLDSILRMRWLRRNWDKPTLSCERLVKLSSICSGRCNWTPATSNPGPEVRDGARALEVAASSFENLRDPQAAVLDTLAAAYAASGQFDRALEVATKAKAAALAEGNQRLANQIADREKLYAQGTAYIEQ
jgi:hypothetical protein